MRGSIGRAHLPGRAIDNLAIMIAPDMNVALLHQEISRRRGLQGSRYVVSQVDYHVRRTLGEVRLNGFQRAKVPVNVSQDRDSHIARHRTRIDCLD